MRKYTWGFAAVITVLALQITSRGGDADPAKDLVVKAIKAAGGEAKLAPLKAGTCKAKATMQDGNNNINATLDITWQGINQYRVVLAADFMGRAKNATLVINGEKGWLKDMDRGKIEEAPKDAVPMITSALYAMRIPQMLPGLLDKDVKLSPLGEVNVAGRAALGVTVSQKDRKDVRLFFDKENSLPVKSEIQLTDRGGREQNFEFHYLEYKDAGGAKHPMRISMKVEKADIVLELSDVKTQAKLDASLFAAPE